MGEARLELGSGTGSCGEAEPSRLIVDLALYNLLERPPRSSFGRLAREFKKAPTHQVPRGDHVPKADILQCGYRKRQRDLELQLIRFAHVTQIRVFAELLVNVVGSLGIQATQACARTKGLAYDGLPEANEGRDRFNGTEDGATPPTLCGQVVSQVAL